MKPVECYSVADLYEVRRWNIEPLLKITSLSISTDNNVHRLKIFKISSITWQSEHSSYEEIDGTIYKLEPSTIALALKFTHDALFEVNTLNKTFEHLKSTTQTANNAIVKLKSHLSQITYS